MPEANIITGQYVQISQSPASLGERIVAQIIDDFLIICYLVGVTLLIAELNLTFFSNELFFLLAIYLPAIFYHFLMELFNHGQSVGKMVMRIRVVKKDGTTPEKPRSTSCRSQRIKKSPMPGVVPSFFTTRIRITILPTLCPWLKSSIRKW